MVGCILRGERWPCQRCDSHIGSSKSDYLLEEGLNKFMRAYLSKPALRGLNPNRISTDEFDINRMRNDASLVSLCE
jgi:hypothetical protein